ncbi:hypothetical protein GCM10027610_065760 [Dactylosporangium cerinum]
MTGRLERGPVNLHGGPVGVGDPAVADVDDHRLRLVRTRERLPLPQQFAGHLGALGQHQRRVGRADVVELPGQRQEEEPRHEPQSKDRDRPSHSTVRRIVSIDAVRVRRSATSVAMRCWASIELSASFS